MHAKIEQEGGRHSRHLDDQKSVVRLPHARYNQAANLVHRELCQSQISVAFANKRGLGRVDLDRRFAVSRKDDALNARA